MKKRNLVGTLVAVVGSAAAMGTAFALYKVGTSPASKVFTIGAHTAQDVTLSVAGVSDDAKALQPGQSRKVDFNLGFSTGAESLYSQDVYLAKVTVTVTAQDEALATALRAKSTLAIGTVSETPEYVGYWAGHQPTAAGTGNTVVFSGHYPVYKSGVKCELELAIGSKAEVTDSAFLTNMASKTYTVSVAIAEPDASYEMAYVLGPSGWSESDTGMMVPNPKATDFEWMYKVSSTEGAPNYIANQAEFKCKKGSTWEKGAEGGANHKHDSSKHGIYWDGQSTSSAIEG